LNHGTLGAESFGQAASLWIGFDRPLTAERLHWMIDTCPESLAGAFCADPALFHCETPGPETFASAVSRLYGDDMGDVSPKASARFGEALEAWACKVHARTPIAFFCGPGTARRGFYDRDRLHGPGSARISLSPWAQWSASRMPVVIDWLEDYLDAQKDIPLTEADAPVDDDWPASPMTRLTLSFLVESLPEGMDVDGTAEAVDDLRERLDYRG
jgi:hypothetical protein